MECRILAHWQETGTEQSAPCEKQGLYDEWFGVPGDLDDFIFYGEELPAVSTK